MIILILMGFMLLYLKNTSQRYDSRVFNYYYCIIFYTEMLEYSS